ncbi:TrkH family potassium uptake protein [Candidatus Rariloculus sp.]|uniref:TrkH family potassium uptake protein n=1 Tax=Candidatus Rariloculus sp. TaxID=3101265 RepID=UPI003D0D0ABD
MTAAIVQRVLGLLIVLFSSTMLLPIGWGLYFDDGTWSVFVASFLIVAGIGLALWWPVRRRRQELRLRGGFLVVALAWIVLGTLGATPLLLADAPQMSFTDAVFEAVSGLTTTGATVLVGLDSLPPSILFYRQLLQWVGGLGIIVFAVAIMPLLGVGGMQLYRAETPGPARETRLTPRVTQTAKALLNVYVGITFVCGAAYWLAGMSFFDAVCHSFSTVAIGGFSTHDASIGYFNSPLIELVAVVFMFIAAVNFALHFLAWRDKRLTSYLTDPEFRSYAWILGVLSTIVLGYLLWQQQYGSVAETVTKGLFQAVSIATTTGYTTDDFAAWPGALPVLLIFASFIGGCAGSTAGGMKVMRWSLIYKQSVRELQRLVHPSAEIPVKLGTRAVHPRVVDSVWGFFAAYIIVFIVIMLILLTTGMDQTSAFAAVAATINNLGPGLGDVSSGFGEVTVIAKWCGVCAMLLGRLEIFTLLVLITPTFWRG